jgi:hypothetical protein
MCTINPLWVGSQKSRFDQAIADRYAQAYPDGTFGVDGRGSLDEWHAAAAKGRAQSRPKEAGNNTEPGTTPGAPTKLRGSCCRQSAET